MKTNNKSFLFPIFLLLVLFISCTDVPISYKTTIPDNRILGFWQNSVDSDAFYIKKNADNTASFVEYKYDHGKNDFIAHGEAKKIFFTTIEDKIGKENFLSVDVANPGEEPNYENVNFSITASGDLITYSIDDNFLKKFQKTKSKDESIITFSKPSILEDIVRSNMRNPKLYDNNATYKKSICEQVR